MLKRITDLAYSKKMLEGVSNKAFIPSFPGLYHGYIIVGSDNMQAASTNA